VDYSGVNGFLGTRASVMVDVVVVAMIGVLFVMAWSIFQVKYRRRFLLHKRLQLTLGVTLAFVLLFFEIDLRLLSPWRERALASPHYHEAWFVGAVSWSLVIHLVFAVSTALLWSFVIVMALRRFPVPPEPTDYSRQHIFWARLAAIDMVLTTLSGWIFYWFAFVAS
jgi:hypothetical protein